MASSLVAFVVASLLAFFAARYVLDGILLPIVIAVFCGLAAATVLNASDVLAHRTGRGTAGDAGDPDRDARREDGRAP